MIEMTPEVKKQLLDLGKGAIEIKDISRSLEKLYGNSLKVMENIIGTRELHECGVYYKYPDESSKELSRELFTWAIGLICIRYNLYLLKRKAIEGHCNNETHEKKCPQGQKFHSELFDEVKKSFEELITHDYEQEVKNDLGIL